MIGDTSVGEGLSENDSGLEITNENSPLTAAEPPSPFCPKQNGGAASPAGTQTHVLGSASGTSSQLLQKVMQLQCKSIRQDILEGLIADK